MKLYSLFNIVALFLTNDALRIDAVDVVFFTFVGRVKTTLVCGLLLIAV